MKRLFQRQGRGRGHQRRELECLYCGKREFVDSREEAAFTVQGCTRCRGQEPPAGGEALGGLFRQMLVRHQLRHVTGPDHPCAWPGLVRRFERVARAAADADARQAPHPCGACYWRADEAGDAERCALGLNRPACGVVAIAAERAAIEEAQRAFRALPMAPSPRSRRRRRAAPEHVQLGELARDLLGNLPGDEGREFLAYVASHGRRGEHGEQFWCDCCAEHEDGDADGAWHEGTPGEHVYVYTDIGHQVLCDACFGNQASVRCGRCGMFFDRFNEGETLVADAMGYASLFCFACAYPLLYGLDDFNSGAREEVQREIAGHGWRVLEHLPDDPDSDAP